MAGWVTQIKLEKTAENCMDIHFDSNLPDIYKKKVSHHKPYSGNIGNLIPIQWSDVKTALNALNIGEQIEYWFPIKINDPPPPPSINGAEYDATLVEWILQKPPPPTIGQQLKQKINKVAVDTEDLITSSDWNILLDRLSQLDENELLIDEQWIDILRINTVITDVLRYVYRKLD